MEGFSILCPAHTPFNLAERHTPRARAVHDS